MRAVCLFALALSHASAIKNTHQFMEKLEVDDMTSVNPIRKVVTMLQKIQTKVAKEGEKEKAMFDRFMCYCEKSDSTLAGSIATGENKVSELGTSLKEHTAQKAQLAQELTSDKATRVEANAAMESATALREKEASAHAKDSAALNSNIQALDGAITASSKGVAGAFLQTGLAATVRKIVLDDPSMDEANRQDLMAFLSEKDGGSYVPASEQIIGILKNIKDGMDKNLADATATEKDAISSFDGLTAAKTKQVQALQKAIEAKTTRVGELAVTVSMEGADLDDTTKAVSQDTTFLADLATNCKTKKAEWAEIVESRAAETVALADTIKLLSDDDALELFKKTLPGSSLIQLDASADAMRSQALTIITKAQRSAKPRGLALDFVGLALHGKKVGFASVIKLIDNMVVTLQKEQVDDDSKNEYCGKQFDSANDKKKNLNQALSDLDAAMASAAESIAETKTELEQLGDGIKALDKSVADATDQRKVEHTDYTELMSNDAAAKELLEFAKKRLNKFYHPTKAVAAPEASEAFVQDDASSAPDSPTLTKKTQENDGVINMLNQIVADVDKEMQIAESDEKYAQKEYEQMMVNSANKRASDSKLMLGKEGMKAEMESELQDNKVDKASTIKSAMGNAEYIGTLHKECDSLLKYIEVRRSARTDEIEALGNAKAVLSGADYSLVQRKSLRARN